MPNLRPSISIPRVVQPRILEVIQYPGNGIAGGLAGVSRIRIPTGEVLQDINILVQGNVTIAAVNGVITPEQPLALIRDLQIVGSSRVRPQVGEIKRADGAAFYQFQRYMRGTPGNVTALANANIQAATPFAFDLEISFELLRALDSRVSLLNTLEMSNLDLLIQWEDETGLATHGVGGTVTINNCTATIRVKEFTDAITKASRYCINRFSTIESAIAAANARFPVEVKRGQVLRGLFLKQFTQAAVQFHTPVATIINTVSVEVNRNPHTAPVTWAQLIADNKYIYGIEALPVGYAFVDFMERGNRDTLIDTRVMDTVDLVLDVNAVANGRVRIYPCELIPVTGR